MRDNDQQANLDKTGDDSLLRAIDRGFGAQPEIERDALTDAIDRAFSADDDKESNR